MPNAQFDIAGKITSFKPCLMPPVVMVTENSGVDFKEMAKALRLKLQGCMKEIANKIYPMAWQKKGKLFAAGNLPAPGM